MRGVHDSSDRVLRLLRGDGGGCDERRGDELHALGRLLRGPGCSRHRHQRTGPYRPRINGKVERFLRTLLEEWAYVRLYSSNGARLATLRRWVHRYNLRRPHTALGGKPPASRL